ncbi:hypothetical protein OVX87_32155 [Klebsiella pneumoniae]|nr:hypothetical protein [Klebsiella pneumoniae]
MGQQCFKQVRLDPHRFQLRNGCRDNALCHGTGGQHVGCGCLHNIAAKAQAFTAIEAIAFILIAIELYGPVLGFLPDLSAKFRVK